MLAMLDFGISCQLITTGFLSLLGSISSWTTTSSIPLEEVDSWTTAFAFAQR